MVCGIRLSTSAAWIAIILRQAEARSCGICEKYLSEDENGELHLDGICLVAGLGGANRRSGTLIIICPNRSLRMTQRALVRFYLLIQR